MSLQLITKHEVTLGKIVFTIGTATDAMNNNVNNNNAG